VNDCIMVQRLNESVKHLASKSMNLSLNASVTSESVKGPGNLKSTSSNKQKQKLKRDGEGRKDKGCDGGSRSKTSSM